jgi:hypothetical protein
MREEQCVHDYTSGEQCNADPAAGLRQQKANKGGAITSDLMLGLEWKRGRVASRLTLAVAVLALERRGVQRYPCSHCGHTRWPALYDHASNRASVKKSG